MQLEISAKRKLPRLFLAHGDNLQVPVAGVSLIWPDRSLSNVFDLSFAGILVSSQGVVNKLKIGEFLTVRLKLEATTETVLLKVRVAELKARSIGLAIDTIKASERLRIEQNVKDNLLLRNFTLMSSASLHPSLQARTWYHGPFDSNLFIWKTSDDALISKAVIEYDNLILLYELGKFTVLKSMSATERARGYEAPMIEAQANVSRGTSWLERLIKLLDAFPNPPPELLQLLPLIRLLRAH